ncbi:MAG: hypothetical protein ABI182_05795 [Candidatus Baltobacteraceae bacterium]
MKSNLYAVTLATVLAAASTAGLLAHSAANPAAGSGSWLAGASAPALADQDGRLKHKGKKGGSSQAAGYYQNGVWYGNRNTANDGDDAQSKQAGRDPHGCLNPSGHQRGWCKQQGYGSNGNRGANQRITGTVIGVSGNTVTLLQGLSTIRINDQIALNNGQVNNLYPTRSVTAYGYWQGGTFVATSIG